MPETYFPLADESTIDLPPEILLKISSYLPLEDNKNLRITTKQLNETATDAMIADKSCQAGSFLCSFIKHNQSSKAQQVCDMVTSKLEIDLDARFAIIKQRLSKGEDIGTENKIILLLGLNHHKTRAEIGTKYFTMLVSIDNSNAKSHRKQFLEYVLQSIILEKTKNGFYSHGLCFSADIEIINNCIKHLNGSELIHLYHSSIAIIKDIKLHICAFKKDEYKKLTCMLANICRHLPIQLRTFHFQKFIDIIENYMRHKNTHIHPHDYSYFHDIATYIINLCHNLIEQGVTSDASDIFQIFNKTNSDDHHFLASILFKLLGRDIKSNRQEFFKTIFLFSHLDIFSIQFGIVDNLNHFFDKNIGLITREDYIKHEYDIFGLLNYSHFLEEETEQNKITNGILLIKYMSHLLLEKDILPLIDLILEKHFSILNKSNKHLTPLVSIILPLLNDKNTKKIFPKFLQQFKKSPCIDKALHAQLALTTILPKLKDKQRKEIKSTTYKRYHKSKHDEFRILCIKLLTELANILSLRKAKSILFSDFFISRLDDDEAGTKEFILACKDILQDNFIATIIKMHDLYRANQVCLSGNLSEIVIQVKDSLNDNQKQQYFAHIADIAQYKLQFKDYISGNIFRAFSTFSNTNEFTGYINDVLSFFKPTEEFAANSFVNFVEMTAPFVAKRYNDDDLLSWLMRVFERTKIYHTSADKIITALKPLVEKLPEKYRLQIIARFNPFSGSLVVLRPGEDNNVPDANYNIKNHIKYLTTVLSSCTDETRRNFINQHMNYVLYNSDEYLAQFLKDIYIPNLNLLHEDNYYNYIRCLRKIMDEHDYKNCPLFPQLPKLM